MGQPFIGEIRLFGGSFAPVGWAFCQGQLMAISENDALFTLIGTTYGGDGQSTFALPDLQGRVPIHMGQGPGITQNYVIGEMAGVEDVTLTTQQIPVHNHAFLVGTAAGTADRPGGHVLATPPALRMFTEDTTNTNLAPEGWLGATGGSQPHTNMQPFLAVSYIISLFGLWPSQT